MGCCDNQVDVDVFQTGSGTGLNMAVNEVIAGLASRLLSKKVHPNDHVNLGQSSNDVVPSAIRIALVASTKKVLVELDKLINSLEERAAKYRRVIKPGRTHLRDALPVTLGMELDAYAEALRQQRDILYQVLRYVAILPLGGTAVGTGLNTHEKFPELTLRYLVEATSLKELRLSKNKNTPMRLLVDILQLSSVYKAIALILYKISQDFRLMYSGPVTGFNEIEIEVEIPGSSMMPGKKNPVTLEAVQQAYAYISGMEDVLERSAILGEFELSMGIPLAGYSATKQSEVLVEAIRKLREKVIQKFRPKVEKMKNDALKSPALITVLAPLIGYDEAEKLVEKIERGEILPEDQKKLIETISRIPLENLVKPGYPARE